MRTDPAEQGTYVAAARIDGVVVGTLAGIDEEGTAIVDLPPGFPGDRVASVRAILPPATEDVGKPVALMFEGGDPWKPIIMGVVQAMAPNQAGEASTTTATAGIKATADGESLVLEATRDVVIRCGRASITLTRAGKVLLRGTYLLSRSSGVNRIKGGSVQIN